MADSVSMAAATAAPFMATIAGTEYRVGRLRLAELGEYDQWRRKQLGDRLRAVANDWPLADRIAALTEIVNAPLTIETIINDVQDVQAAMQLFWLARRNVEPAATRNELAAAVGRLGTAAQVELVNAVLLAVSEFANLDEMAAAARNRRGAPDRPLGPST